MTDDELDAMQRSLGLRTESLRLARERATTPGERAILDEVEAQIREDARRYAEAVRVAERDATARAIGDISRQIRTLDDLRRDTAHVTGPWADKLRATIADTQARLRAESEQLQRQRQPGEPDSDAPTD